MDSYIGQLLDNRYEIIERIGVGGMAMVYKARCHRLNRLVAIKILRDDLAQDGDFRRRFHDESKAVAMLSHPNIVSVYDVNRSSVSEYIVMELIDGITLKQYIKEKDGVINWRESLHFMIQIIKALGHAHSRGIIHRDIKPHNIMVLRDGSVKVADFGIARLIGGNHSTLTQEALGSVHYISPEQARGSRIDARSDLYSAGVVLYEMTTGRLPFEGDSAVSVAIQHINSVPLTPREVNPELPEALEAITMKAMAAKVDNRYSSADEMLESLEEFRKNPSINFDYKMELTPLENLDPSAVTQVLPPTPSVPKTPQPPKEKSQNQSQNPTSPQGGSNGTPPQGKKKPPQPPPQKIPPQRPPQKKPPNNPNGQPPQRAKTSNPNGGNPNGGQPRQPNQPPQNPPDGYIDYTQPRPRKTSKFPWGIFVAVLIFLIFLTGVASFLYMVFFSTPTAPILPTEEQESTLETYTIPSVKGYLFDTIAGNTGILQEFQLIIEDTVNDNTPEGTIISQNPLALAVVTDEKTQIRVVISSGPEIIKMINVENQEYLKAQMELRNLGLSVASPIYEFHDTIPYNNVISFSPVADTPMSSGDMVQLVVSKGPESKKVQLPNFIGESQSWAESRLDYLNLAPVIKTEYSATVSEGEVMNQFPAEGTEVAEGTDVNLLVSLGVDPNTLPQTITKTVTIALPDVPLSVDGDMMSVQVTMDDRIEYTANVDPALTTSVSFDVEGSGVKVLTIYFDGMPAGTQTVDFDEVLH